MADTHAASATLRRRARPISEPRALTARARSAPQEGEVTETVASWTAVLPPYLRPVARKARTAIRSAFPDFTEYVKNAVVGYGSSTLARDWLLYLSAQRDHVNLGFVQGLGSLMSDPHRLIHGT